MHEISIQSLVFFSLVWLVGFLTCFARTIRDAEYRDAWHCFSISVCAGFLCFGVCAVVDAGSSGRFISPTGWLGISALIGLLAKEQDKIGRAVLFKVLLGMRAIISGLDDQAKDDTRSDRHDTRSDKDDTKSDKDDIKERSDEAK